MIKKIVNYQGKIIFNRKYFDGVKVRKVNSSIIKKLGWHPKIKLKAGLVSYCDYYEKKFFLKRDYLSLFDLIIITKKE